MEVVLNYELWEIALLLVAGFFAAFIDASVGGGGLISVPAYMCLGWPIPNVIATNKVGAVVSLCTSAYTYFKAGKTDPFAKKIIPCSFCAAIAGALTVYIIPPEILRYLVVAMLVLVGVYTFLKKDFGAISKPNKNPNYKRWFLIVALVIGFYDGFFGPGSGMFYAFAFILLGFDYVEASANCKIMTSTAMLGSLVTFALKGSVIWSYGLIMALSMMPGAYLGSKFVIKYGTKWIRPIYLAMVILMIGKQVFDLIK